MELTDKRTRPPNKAKNAGSKTHMFGRITPQSVEPCRRLAKITNASSGKSPSWEIVNTFSPALSVGSRNAQCWTKKNDMILIASQKKRIDRRSYVAKNHSAAWENNALSKTIEDAPASYSKYSTRKKKHTTRAKLSTAKKIWPTQSKHNTSAISTVGELCNIPT